MDTLVLNIERIRMVLTMFRITQGELEHFPFLCSEPRASARAVSRCAMRREGRWTRHTKTGIALARASGVSTAMVSLLLAGKKRPSTRTAVALVHGVEKLLTRDCRLDTAFFVGSDENTITSSHVATNPPIMRRCPQS